MLFVVGFECRGGSYSSHIVRKNISEQMCLFLVEGDLDFAP